MPGERGCYVLSTVSGNVLYIGLTVNLRNRMGQHLENAEKRAPTEQGRPTIFHWCLAEDILPVERGWMNLHIQHEGGVADSQQGLLAH